MAQNTPILGKIKSSESAASLDAKYGPYASKAAANAALGENGDDVITAGLTVGVTQSDGSVKEFWYQPDGQGGLQLVEKQVAGGTEVEANPAGEATTTLNKIKIGETNYNIPQTDTSNLATKQELQQGLSGKQDTIADLEQIRTRADEGHTALQPLSGAQENNFASFDSNGGIKDSSCNEGSFIKGVKKGTETLTPVNGVVTIPSDIESAHAESVASNQSATATIDSNHVLQLEIPRGSDAVNPFKGWFDADITGEAGSKVVDDTANLPVSPTVGDYAYVKTLDITGVAPSQTETPVVKIYECTTAGTWSDSGRTADTSNVQTFASGEEVNETSIDNDFVGGSDKIAGAEEVKELSEATTVIITSDNILNPQTLKVERDTVTNANGVTVIRYKGIVNYDGVERVDSSYLSKEWGYTDFIPFGNHNDITINYGARSSTIETGSIGRRTALIYDSEKNFLEYKTLSSSPTSEDTTIKGGDRFTVVKDSYNGTPYAYVRFNLGNPEGLPYDGHAVYYDLGTEGELPTYQPYYTKRIMRVVDNLDSDDAETPLSARQGKILNNKPASNISSNAKIIIDRENVNFLEKQNTSKNLLNPDKIIERIGIERQTGKEKTPSSAVAVVGCTDYVDVLQNTYLVCNKGWNTSTYGWAAYRLATQEEIEDDTITKFYHDEKTLVFAHGGPGGSNPTYTVYSYVNGDLYIRYSLMSLDDVQIEVGDESTSYEPYSERTIINSVLLPEITPPEPIESKVEVQLPNEIVVCEGDRLQLFWRNCVKIPNPYIYNISGSCKQSNSDSYIGLSYPRYFQLDAKSSMVNSNYTLTVSVNNGKKTIGEATTNIRVVAKATSPVSQKNILILGASTYANTTSTGVVHGYIGNELNRRLTSLTGDGTPSNPTGLGLSNISFIGTVETDNGLMQEVRPGWGWKDFATTGRQSYYFYVDSSVHVYMGDVYSGNGTLRFTVDEVNVENGYFSAIPSGSGTQPSSGTLTKVSGEGDGTITYISFEQMSRNPLWNNGTNKLDFINYVENECELGSGSKIDYVICGLGFNDLIAGKRSIETTVGYIKDFLDALIEDFSDVKVVIAPLALVSPFGGFTKDYGTRPNYLYWNNDLIVWNYNSALLDLIEEYPNNLIIAPSTYLFDSEHLYPSADYNVCNRNTSVKESLQTNGVHFTQQGAFTVADTIFNTFMDIL